MEGVLSKNAISENGLSVLIDAQENCNTLLIAFGGISHQLPIPVFEFFRSLDGFKVNKIFIRDFKQCWYTNGIEGISSTTEETLAYLREKIKKYGADKTVFIGNSAGGFAALLFGYLLQVNEAHAFSPQTFINRRLRLRHADFRWKKEIKSLNSASSYLDLKKVFKDNTNTITKFHLYWDENHRLDNIHAKRMTFKSVMLKPQQAGGHEIIKNLRDSGKLLTIIENAVHSS